MKIYLISFLIMLSSCSIEKENKDSATLPLDNYLIVDEFKYHNLVEYSFFCSLKEDSIEWEIPDAPRISLFMHSKEISRIHVFNYRGQIPDSLDLTHLNHLIVENSIVQGNPAIFANTKTSVIEMYNSFFYDSLFDLKIFKNLIHLRIQDSKTNFVINDYLPLEQMRYIEEDSLHFPREIHFAFDKLPNLKAMKFECRKCKIDIPHDSLNLMYKKDENGIEITKGSYPIIDFLNQE